MAILTRSEIKSFAGKKHFAKGSRSVADVSVFLSHSHKDRDLVEGVIGYLASLGISVYVDWQDGEMPETCTAETAGKIKMKITENQRFLLLATDNSIASVWVPWELGIADGLKGKEKIAILPVKNDYGSWTGNEYIGLYPTIQTDGVIPANRYLAVSSTNEWLRKGL